MRNAWATAAVIQLVTLYSCSPPLHFSRNFSWDMSHLKQLSELQKQVPIRGSGKIEYVVDGERQTGWFDVHYGRDSTFSATFYSPVGTIVGSVAAANDSGIFSFNGQIRALTNKQALDTLFFPWGSEVRLEDLTSALCGKIRPSIGFLHRPPDEVQTSCNRITYLWKEPENEIYILFSRCLLRLKRIIVKYSPKNGRDYTLSYNSFLGRHSRMITLTTDDRNYFSIKHERLRK